MTDLLPANSTGAERAISAATDRAGAIQTPAGLMWDAARIPAEYLPWLAWAVSVDYWDPDWTEAQKRAAIAGSAAWHRLKGTRGSVVTVLALEGFASAEVIEDRDLPRLGRDWVLGRGWRLGPSAPHWADYWIVAHAPLYREAAERLAQRLADTAPARCRLRSIRADGAHRFVLGRGWTLGDHLALGSIYHQGDDNHG